VTYFITFTCYGTHLHGDADGSVDRNHRAFGAPTRAPDVVAADAARNRMAHPPYRLDEARRSAVLQALRRICEYRGWTLIAAHVRSTHVHSVIAADVAPEKVMADLKVYTSRQLNDLFAFERGNKRWTRHGSTRYLWNADHVAKAVAYVVNEQGSPMSVYVSEDEW